MDRDVLYFGYGSNLNAPDLKRWCKTEGAAFPLGRSLGAARIPDMELCFDYESNRRKTGVLDLRSRVGQVVEGKIFEVNDGGWEVLDRKEGVPTNCYERLAMHVLRDTGELVEATTYTVLPRRRREFVEPNADYIRVVRNGLRSFGLAVDQFEAASRNQPVPLVVDALFVYGTLIRGEPNFDVLTGGRELECALPATMTGRMVDLGCYPAVVREGRGQVHGEFVRVRDLAGTLCRLDQLEGFHGYDANSLYHRVTVRVDIGGSQSRDAWTYVLADSGGDHPVVASGNWREYQDRPVI